MSSLNLSSVLEEGSDDVGPRPFQPGAAATVAPLTRDFLAWVASRPRSYADAMEAWRTSCPRLSIWEDALDAGLVGVEREDGLSLGEARVVLTPRGRAILDGR